MQVVDDTKVRSRFSIAGHPQVIELICPHCLKEATFTVKAWSEHAGQVAATEVPCPRCNIGVLFLELLDHRDSHDESTLYMHPDPVGREGIAGVEHLRTLSSPLARSYDSALKLYNHGEWGSAALTVRHLLEGLATRLLGDAQRDLPLARQLEALPKDVDLAKPLQDIAPLLAPGGTFGRQFDDETSIDQVTAEQLLDLAEQLISYLVVLPGTMAELKSRIATAPVPLRRGASNSAA
ncbi:hypothetical protein [Lysobacter sp. CFH 32150]|uniref:hypothetical protein n=1 Tax=Lysobacter sp. CFH 32150 TaxID=2927128 RepID=UPI001FA6ED99|nr:hypothetical protein [Lysobacter sp. CFH 32150]MCI4567603.1 hypothetical protein [Lysobacter sp. CFH 32150]